MTADWAQLLISDHNLLQKAFEKYIVCLFSLLSFYLIVKQLFRLHNSVLPTRRPF